MLAQNIENVTEVLCQFAVRELLSLTQLAEKEPDHSTVTLKQY